MREDSKVDNDPLRAALQPVLDDLEATKPGVIDVAPHGDDIWLRDRVGHGPALPAQWREFPDEMPLNVVETAQEAVIEALWSMGESAVWPVCPHHPETHPLIARATTEGLVWTCPASGSTVAAVGRLARG